jgi:hypothetical protein
VELQQFTQAILAEASACLANNELFVRSSSRREQCAHAYRVLRENHVPKVPLSVIGRLLEIGKSTVSKQWRKWNEHQNPELERGRDPLISNDIMDQIIAWVEMMWDGNQPSTFYQLREFIAGT